MAAPLMPKATALWLIENTSLTFEQIADFCYLHILEVQAIADGEVGVGIAPFDPLLNNQLLSEDIARCEKDTNGRLQLIQPTVFLNLKKGKAKYTPLSRRADRPSAIAWLLKHYPDLKEGEICRLLGTTKNTILAIKNRSHRNSAQIKPSHPVKLGLCSQEDLERAVAHFDKPDSLKEES